MKRCPWATNDLSIAYHDREWCVPRHDDRVHFEFITLEGAQAGLSWDTILRKRDRYCKAFAEFDPERVARFTRSRVERLLQDPGIIRNRAKVESTILNAKALLRVRDEFGSFDKYVWEFVDGKQQRNSWRRQDEVPATSAVSDRMSKDLRKRGFSFVGSTICYSYMQAVGLINDHLVTCFRYRA